MSALIETVSSSRAFGARIEEITQMLSHAVRLCDLKSRRLFEAGFRKGAQALAAVDATLRGEVLIPLTAAHKTTQASIGLFSAADVPNLDTAAIALKTGNRQLVQLHAITERTTRELLRQLDAITRLGNQMLEIRQVTQTAHQTLTEATKHAEAAIRSAKMAQRALDIADFSSLENKSSNDYSANLSYRSTAEQRKRFRETFFEYDLNSTVVHELARLDTTFAGIPEEDLVALYAYTCDSFYEINRALRDNDLAALAQHDAHIRCITSALNQLPQYSGAAYRGISVDPEKASQIAQKYEPGRTIRETSFFSTDTAAGFPGNILFEIQSRTGRLIKGISEFGASESEVLFSPGAKFKVLARTLDPEIKVWRIALNDVSGEK